MKCNGKKSGNVINRVWETYSTDQRHDASRLKQTRTGENMITVKEMVCLLNHKGQKQTYRSIRQISKDTDLSQEEYFVYQHTCCL